MNRSCLSVVVLVSLFPLTPCFAVSPGEKAFLELVGRTEDGIVIPLWPGNGTPPNKSRSSRTESVETSTRTGNPAIKNVSTPSIVVVRSKKGTGKATVGTTLLFAPGGGYGQLGLNVAADLCRWADAIGAHFVLLKYRVPKISDDLGHQFPLSDAQRAIRLLRHKAKELGIDGEKIVIIGASAGGHLSFNLANNHSQTTYQHIDEIDALSAKPNAAVLLYPAYLTNPFRSLKTDKHLNLADASQTRTSPIFMTVTRPDKFTWGAIGTMLHLRKAKIPAELHIYPDGGHGGCFDNYPLMNFIQPAARFLKDKGVFTESMQLASNRWLNDLRSDYLDRPASPGRPPRRRITAVVATRDRTTGDKALAALGEPGTTVIPLWPSDGTRSDDPAAALEEELPQRPDGLVRITKVSRPTLHHWQPQHPDGRAVIVFPGGAYNGLAAEHEGTQIAAWLNQQGITAFVAKYRVPRREGLEKHAVALQDAQRAIRIVRSHAADFGIDPQQIGVLGFSAGGHLATLTVHKAATSSYTAIDDADKTSARPDFAILIYPAYLTQDGKGESLDPLITPLRSRNHYPPIYMAVAADDRFAPSSLHYLLHLHQAKVPGELHVYESGGHGKGLREIGGPFAQWTRSCEQWLSDLKHGTDNITIK